MNKLIPIDCLEKELCVLCCIDLVAYEYMTPDARDLFDTLTEQEKQEVKTFIERME